MIDINIGGNNITMNKIIFNLLLISIFILCNCTPNTKVYSTGYEKGIISIESKDILLNIIENHKFKQYKLIFTGKELIREFIKEITSDQYSPLGWEQQLIDGTIGRNNPPGKYIKFKTKKIGEIEIEQFDKIEFKRIYHDKIPSCVSKLRIKLKNSTKEIIIKDSHLMDYTIIKNNNKNYLFVLQGTQGSGSFSSIIDIYKL